MNMCTRVHTTVDAQRPEMSETQELDCCELPGVGAANQTRVGPERQNGSESGWGSRVRSTESHPCHSPFPLSHIPGPVGDFT